MFLKKYTGDGYLLRACVGEKLFGTRRAGKGSTPPVVVSIDLLSAATSAVAGIATEVYQSTTE